MQELVFDVSTYPLSVVDRLSQMNVPNFLTILRVFFAVEVFVFCAFHNWELCLLFFALAAATDFVDGWWARKYNQITVFGRIMDPFADKFLICGTFICLLAVLPLTSERMKPLSLIPNWMMLQPWMVIVIVTRELFITSLRAAVEQHGGDFSAKWIGKWKMGVQCAAVAVCFVYLSLYLHSAFWDRFGLGLNSVQVSLLYFLWICLLWGTVLITLYSGISYSYRAAAAIKSNKDTIDSLTMTSSNI